MTEKKKLFLPKVAIDATKDEIDLEDGFTFEYKLKLVDSSENPITSFKAIDSGIKAVLTIFITNSGNTEFPDPNEWLIYRFASTDWLEKDSSGNLKIPQNKKKEFHQRMNRMNGDFVKRYAPKDFSIDKGGKNNPKEGLENTDMRYRIETNDTPSVPGSPGIRIDIYSTNDATRKPIVEDKIEVNLVLNKKIQINLEEDGVITYSVSAPSPKWKWWQISLISLAVLAGLAIILGIIFHRQIKDWWKKKKNKKESQLEIF